MKAEQVDGKGNGGLADRKRSFGTASLDCRLRGRRIGGTLSLNIGWSLVGNGVYAVCQGGVLVILSRSGDAEDVVRFALALALATPIMIFAGFALRQVQATDAARSVRFSDYLGVRLGATVLAFFAILAVAMCLGYRGLDLEVIVMVAAAKAFDSVSDIYHGLFQMHERLRYSAEPLVINGILSLVLLSAGLFVVDSQKWGIMGWTFASAATLALCHVHYAPLVGVVAARPTWDWRTVQGLLRLTAPLAVVVLLNALAPNVPRYAVEFILPRRDLGVFASLAYLLFANWIVVGALGQAARACLVNRCQLR